MSERKSASYCRWCKTENPREANCCANCGAEIPWPRKQFIAYTGSFALLMANMLNVGLMISLGVPQLTRLLSVSLFSILGFVLAAYALKTLGRLPEVSPIGRGGAVIIIGGLFTILCIYMALADWPVSA